MALIYAPRPARLVARAEPGPPAYSTATWAKLLSSRAVRSMVLTLSTVHSGPVLPQHIACFCVDQAKLLMPPSISTTRLSLSSAVLPVIIREPFSLLTRTVGLAGQAPRMISSMGVPATSVAFSSKQRLKSVMLPLWNSMSAFPVMRGDHVLIPLWLPVGPPPDRRPAT